MPVPYTIVAKQEDDANTAATVRMTGQRAHKQSSIVTQSTGDEPGTGLGVKSGTVGSVCHRKEHSSNVRIEGEWATRHGDEWWMNNKNTIGKLVYVKSTESFEKTPPLKEAPAAKKTSQVTMTDAQPFQYLVGEKYAFDFTNAPGGKPPPLETTPAPEKPPVEVTPEEPKKKKSRDRWWKRVVKETAKKAVKSPAAIPAIGAGALPVGVGTIGIMRGKAAAEDGLIRSQGGTPPLRTPFFRQPVRIDPRLSPEPQLQPQPQLEKKKEPTLETKLDVPPKPNERTKGNVRTTRGCPIGPHASMKPICARGGMQAHHVVPDRTFRYAGSSGPRMPGPSYSQGLAVCVEPNTMGSNSEHSRIHNQYYDPTATREATLGSAPGFIRLSRAEDLGAQALELGTNGRCNKEFIRKSLREYHQKVFKLEPDTLVRGQKNGLTPTQLNGLNGQTGGIIGE